MMLGTTPQFGSTPGSARFGVHHGQFVGHHERAAVPGRQQHAELPQRQQHTVAEDSSDEEDEAVMMGMSPGNLLGCD